MESWRVKSCIILLSVLLAWEHDDPPVTYFSILQKTATTDYHEVVRTQNLYGEVLNLDIFSEHSFVVTATRDTLTSPYSNIVTIPQTGYHKLFINKLFIIKTLPIVVHEE